MIKCLGLFLRAYEHAYDLLEHTFLPLFHQSDDVRILYLSHLLPCFVPSQSYWQKVILEDNVLAPKFQLRLHFCMIEALMNLKHLKLSTV